MKREIASKRLLPGLFAQPRWQSLLVHPDDVLCHPDMSADEKRALLAAWASDAHAVVDSPALRQLPSGAVVRLDDILQALRSLDGPPHRAFTGQTRRMAPSKPAGARRMRHSSFGLARAKANGGGGGDDGRDPPSAPAIAGSRRMRAMA